MRAPRRLATHRGRLILAAGVAGLAAGAGLLTLALGPGIERAKQVAATREARRQAALVRTLVTRVRLAQALHEARLPPGGALSAAVERAILADARSRVHNGTLTGKLSAVSCRPYTQGPPQRPGILSLDCLAVQGSARRRAGGPVVARVGIPFWARVDARTGRIAWCRITPRPGEMAVAAALPAVPLAPLCDLGRPAPASW